MSKTDKDTAAATAPVVAEVEIVMDTASDLAAFVDEATANESGKAPARGFTKGGFNSVSALAKLDVFTLSTMAGCIIKSISDQITEDDESPLAALAIISEFSQNVGSLTANSTKLRSYAATAINFGYGSAIGQDEPDIDTLSNAQMAKIAIAFLAAQKGAKVDADFNTWAKELASSEA